MVNRLAEGNHLGCFTKHIVVEFLIVLLLWSIVGVGIYVRWDWKR